MIVMSMLVSFFTNIRWQDILDILLVSYFLFRLYVLFRGTYVFRVIVGIGFLWIFQRIAGYMGLIVTTWAMQGIIAFAAIIIIIVFRNEIRNVLQAKNIGLILWGVSHKMVQTPVQIITGSVYEMAKRRIGALLVFPGKDVLEELVQSGIPWKGVLSKEMVLSVFWPDNPVHDGAAIIQGDRIVEVGVILPLSRRSDLPSSYGTRHRAALGLAEKTDALIILVSEESGKVVSVKGDQVKEISNNIELEKTLRTNTGISSDYTGLRERDKLSLVLAAMAIFLFVAGTWFSFSRGLETLATLQVPIEYMNRDPSMELIASSLNSVNLDLSGGGTLLKSIRPEQVKVRVDLGKAVVGLNSYTITAENITLPPGIVLRTVDPPVVGVTLDIPIVKELPLQVDWAGKLAVDLILEDVELEPDRITVVGGSKILEAISTMYTEKVPLDNLKTSGTMTVKIALTPASLKVGGNSKDRLSISYVIRKRGPLED
jgi:diadenylate cyclase